MITQITRVTDVCDFVFADWPAPANVSALTSTRGNGFSIGSWASLNLADHVGDDPRAVRRNRESLARALDLPGAPRWLQQVHGCEVIDARDAARIADAAYADGPGVVCAVLTADCLPVTLCDRTGREVAVAHCGWRGLAAGVLRATIRRFRASPDQLLAWLGPAIGPAAFEVGAEVREQFLRHAACAEHAHAIDTAFIPSLRNASRLQADLYALARAECGALGIGSVHGGGFCTYADARRFFSFRRDGATGRMATLIWIRE